MKKCLIIGATGFLGRAVAQRLSVAHEVTGVGFRTSSPGSISADIRDPDALRRVVSVAAPDVVVLLAALRDPDPCEENPAEARRINVAPAQALARILPPAVKLLLASTDYVFDGTHPPYGEADARSPLSVYGRTKCEAEDAAAGRPGSLIMRFPVLVGAGHTWDRSGFIYELVRDLRSGRPVVADDILMRFPVWIRDIAEAMAFLLDREASGIFHMSGPDGGTRYQLTQRTAQVLGLPSDHVQPSRQVVPRKAVRPRNSELSTAKIRALGYAQFTPFEEVVSSVLRQFGEL